MDRDLRAHSGQTGLDSETSGGAPDLGLETAPWVGSRDGQPGGRRHRDQGEHRQGRR